MARHIGQPGVRKLLRQGVLVTPNDRLFGDGGGVDRLAGGLGDDTLNTVDGSTNDSVVGDGHVVGDTCVADPGDFIARCE
jgi:hypothetical protein